MLFLSSGFHQYQFNSDKSNVSCDICGAQYKHLSNLSSHRQVHFGKTNCAFCAKVLSRKSHLRRHLFSVHGIEHQDQSPLK